MLGGAQKKKIPPISISQCISYNNSKIFTLDFLPGRSSGSEQHEYQTARNFSRQFITFSWQCGLMDGAKVQPTSQNGIQTGWVLNKSQGLKPGGRSQHLSQKVNWSHSQKVQLRVGVRRLKSGHRWGRNRSKLELGKGYSQQGQGKEQPQTRITLTRQYTAFAAGFISQAAGPAANQVLQLIRQSQGSAAGPISCLAVSQQGSMSVAAPSWHDP